MTMTPGRLMLTELVRHAGALDRKEITLDEFVDWYCLRWGGKNVTIPKLGVREITRKPFVVITLTDKQ